ncbi:hypothetical protein ERJ75_000986100 [Trypanosoma vivax]|uniref:Uncharacterized protein n=1 Tax=Trypanosoma vivax (strain Y486) TaxID=1055687 RepID=G0U741_TRYVY|nr:hypothetical protein TRVL_01270 [Trypanosoma vivax]KAH8611413.1 hypothetical protein ERJ75_000986100 [Trypanosoma vivax]CCC51698.1 conserved hypothetical protein [Trypanosoma vivax Y486]
MPLRTDYARYPRDVREKQNIALSPYERRLADLHFTAYPSVVNEAALPPRAANDDAKGAQAPARQTVQIESGPVALMTTNQLNARLTEMAKEEMRQLEEERKRKPTGRITCGLKCGSVDRRSTYRHDYCNMDVPGFHERVRVISNYTKNWTETEKKNVEESKKFPYLTVPSSILGNRQTVYRHDYIPGATERDFRLLPHSTNLRDSDASFAYSCYTVDDPSRKIKYDEVVASCRNPRCLLWKTYSPRDSLRNVAGGINDSREELRQLRELIRASRLSSERSCSTKQNEEVYDANRRVLLPGLRGMGYRLAPTGEREYIHLPRDHFCHQVVYDY